MTICSHCGRPWEADACRLPGKPIKRELARAPQSLLREDLPNRDDGRNPEVLTR